MENLKDKIMQKLKEVKDPELGFSVVDLGYITKIEELGESKVKIWIVLTTPLCPYGGLIFESVEMAARSVEGVKDVLLEYDWDHPWSVDRVAPEVRKKLKI